MSSPDPTLYDLFDETSFEYWRRQTQDNVLPTPEQLAALLEANPDAPLPDWLRPLVVLGLRGQLKGKGKRGRPPKTALARYCLWAAIGEYRDLLSRLTDERNKNKNQNQKQNQNQSQNKKPEARPTSQKRSADHKPASQIAAEQIVREWHLPMDWRSFLNEVHSEK